MTLLLDTHVLLWMFSRSESLSAPAREALSTPENALFFSIAGYWEIGIKVSIGKLTLADDWYDAIPRHMHRNGINWLQVLPGHVRTVSALPWIHRDPFDRLMIAQAQEEALAIVTSDHTFSEYEVATVW
ncbi:MAG: type II toxin-antitoxin system VapC family toxin [Alkalispirochaeta sp.]